MKGRKTGGRVRGTPNKLTGSARNAFALAFDSIGGAEGLSKWAKENQTDFYRLYARLIPTGRAEVDEPDGIDAVQIEVVYAESVPVAELKKVVDDKTLTKVREAFPKAFRNHKNGNGEF